MDAVNQSSSITQILMLPGVLNIFAQFWPLIIHHILTWFLCVHKNITLKYSGMKPIILIWTHQSYNVSLISSLTSSNEIIHSYNHHYIPICTKVDSPYNKSNITSITCSLSQDINMNVFKILYTGFMAQNVRSIFICNLFALGKLNVQPLNSLT